jgi:hypothetical protein
MRSQIIWQGSFWSHLDPNMVVFGMIVRLIINSRSMSLKKTLNLRLLYLKLPKHLKLLKLNSRLPCPSPNRSMTWTFIYLILDWQTKYTNDEKVRIFGYVWDTDLSDLKIVIILKLYFKVSMVCVETERIKVIRVNNGVQKVTKPFQISVINFQQELKEKIW